MKNRAVMILLALLVVVNVSGFAVLLFHRFAPPRAPGRECVHMPGRPEAAGMRKALRLSPQQAAALRHSRERFRHESRALRDSLRQLQISLASQLAAVAPDTASIDSLIGQIARKQASIHRRAIYSMLEEKNNLDPAQRKIFLRLLGNHLCPEEGLMRPGRLGYRMRGDGDGVHHPPAKPAPKTNH
jgi:Spy/CpxP family protein refolding chaperone